MDYNGRRTRKGLVDKALETNREKHRMIVGNLINARN
jgi:hypothetical protein